MATADHNASSRALSAEIVASERLRTRVLASVLAAIVGFFSLIFTFAPGLAASFATRPPPPWLPAVVGGPFLLYELIAMFVLGQFARKGREPPTFARFANALIETSMPTGVLYVAFMHVPPDAAFGGWPPFVYFVFIVASTLRLNFALPAFTGLVAGVEYVALAAYLLPLETLASDPLFSMPLHALKGGMMVAAGVVAGLVAMRLREKFLRAMEESQARERVTSLFGQHVSPAVVDELLVQPVDAKGTARDVCVMFLDIRNFTAQARGHSPDQVVDYLNQAFAFMIEAIDRHRGIINKFLGDGFLAVFGAPLGDARAAAHAVAAARDILDEIDRRGLATGPWPLRVGIGLHCGPAVTGNVGSTRRKEFTVIGDVVNLASRLEQLTKEVGGRLLVSDAVVAALGAERGSASDLGTVTIKGYAAPVRVWRLDAEMAASPAAV